MMDSSFLDLVLNASFTVQAVMVILLLASMASWWCIFIKFFQLRRAERQALRFEDTFARFREIKNIREFPLDRQGMSSIFEAGIKECMRQEQQRQNDANYRTEMSDMMAGVRRAMRASYNRELDELEAHLPFLATVGSVSPYIGLFGTVWGIMHAFIGLSNASQATLSQVAPGIAEALIATAIGLFAAIPAVIAYNRFSTTVDRLSIRYESCIEELTNTLQRRINT